MLRQVCHFTVCFLIDSSLFILLFSSCGHFGHFGDCIMICRVLEYIILYSIFSGCCRYPSNEFLLFLHFKIPLHSRMIFLPDLQLVVLFQHLKNFMLLPSDIVCSDAKCNDIRNCFNPTGKLSFSSFSRCFPLKRVFRSSILMSWCGFLKVYTI